MGMTIEKAKPKIQFVRNALNDDMEMAKAYDLAILIMGKYQKIEQILKDDTYYEEYGNNAERFIVSAISEVVENDK
jgi:hypothetical protein